MGALIFVVAMVAIGLAALWSWYRKQQRREEIVRFGLQYGLEFSRDDLTGVLDLPFKLFRLGDGRGVENVLSGAFHGQPVREADYWYFTESTDSQGHRTKTYHRFSVAVSPLEADLPDVSVEKENLLTTLANDLSFHDLQFESEAFNRMFNVRAADREFAYKLLDARMLQWLLSTEGAFGFEVNGPWLLVWCRKRRPAELVPLLGSAKLFRDHIPRLVWNELGAGGREGPLAPPDAERSGS